MELLQDPVGLGMVRCDVLVMNVEFVQEGIKVDLTKLGSVVQQFPARLELW